MQKPSEATRREIVAMATRGDDEPRTGVPLVDAAPSSRSRKFRAALRAVLDEAVAAGGGDADADRSGTADRLLPDAVARLEAEIGADPYHDDPARRTYPQYDYDSWQGENARLRRILLDAANLPDVPPSVRVAIGEMIRARPSGDEYAWVVDDRAEEIDTERYELVERVEALCALVGAALERELPEDEVGAAAGDGRGARLPRYWNGRADDLVDAIRRRISDLEEPRSLALLRDGRGRLFPERAADVVGLLERVVEAGTRGRRLATRGSDLLRLAEEAEPVLARLRAAESRGSYAPRAAEPEAESPERRALADCAALLTELVECGVGPYWPPAADRLALQIRLRVRGVLPQLRLILGAEPGAAPVSLDALRRAGVEGVLEAVVRGSYAHGQGDAVWPDEPDPARVGEITAVVAGPVLDALARVRPVAVPDLQVVESRPARPDESVAYEAAVHYHAAPGSIETTWVVPGAAGPVAARDDAVRRTREAYGDADLVVERVVLTRLRADGTRA